MSSLADRIRERLDAVKMLPADLARAARVKPPSVSNWMNGSTKTIKGENLLLAAEALQCSPRWLATGVGIRTIDQAHSQHVVQEETVRYITDPLIEEATEILKALDRTSRSEALQLLRGFAAGRKTPQRGHGHRLPVAN